MVELQTTWNVANKSTNKGELVIFSKLDAATENAAREWEKKKGYA
jgi:hypothetical protein